MTIVEPSISGRRADGQPGRPKLVSPIAIGRSIRSKGARPFVRRLGLISRRFGLGPAPIARAMAGYAAVLRRHNAPATWTVTANAARRHPGVLRPYAGSAVELAIHGWRHTDHQRLDVAAQRAEVDRALEQFARLGYRMDGWRCPYLRAGQGTLDRLAERGLSWDASGSIEFPHPIKSTLDARGVDTWDRAIAFYSAASLETAPALPVDRRGLILFPTAVPDDEILIDRLHLGPATCARVWLDMLDRTRADGELLVMQLHPERARHFAAPLDALLASARAAQPAVWVASLGELAAWWKARGSARLLVDRTDAGWTARVEGPSGPSVERIDPGRPSPAAGDARGVEIVGTTWPGVGVGGLSALATSARLRALGIAAEPRRDGQSYAATLEEPTDRELVAFVRRLGRGEGLAGPLVRLATWPRGYRSALAISGDICALTLGDFAVRLGEMR